MPVCVDDEHWLWHATFWLLVWVQPVVDCLESDQGVPVFVTSLGHKLSGVSGAGVRSRLDLVIFQLIILNILNIQWG